MKYYLLCLEEKRYDVKLGENELIVRSVLENIIDNLVDLLQRYGIEEKDILEEFRGATDIYERSED